MADFSALKTSIQNYIKQNGNEEITGNLLQQILLSMVTTLGDSAINDLVTALNAEIANRANADTTLQGNINSEATTRANADTELGGRITTLQGVVNGIVANIENGYVYAGIATPSSTPASGKVFYLAFTAGTYTNFGATVVPQGINILKYNGTAWSLDSFIGIDDEPSVGSNNLVKSGGVNNLVNRSIGYYKPAILLNRFYNSYGGWIDLYNGYCCTEKIPLYGSTGKIGINPNNSLGYTLTNCCVYDADNSYLGEVTTFEPHYVLIETIINTYPTAKFVGVTFYKSGYTAELTPSDVADFNQYEIITNGLYDTVKRLQDGVEQHTADIQSLQEDVTNLESRIGELEFDVKGEYFPSLILNKFIYTENGSMMDTSGWAVVYLMPLLGTDGIISINPNNSLGFHINNVCCYDTNGTYLGEVSRITSESTCSIEEILSEYPTTAKVSLNINKSGYTETLTAEDVADMDTKQVVSSGLEQRVERLENEMPTEKAEVLLTVDFSQKTVSVRSAFSDTHDIINRMNWSDLSFDGNPCLNFYGAILINKRNSEQTFIDGEGDNISPFYPQYSYIGANHGMGRLYVITAASHGKTFADIGSEWIDENNIKWYIVHIVDENKLWVVSEYYLEGAVYNFYDRITGNLTHNSGATHTSQITITNVDNYQWYPAEKIISRSILLDGKEITESGTYKGNVVDCIETYDIFDPFSYLDKLISLVGTLTENPMPNNYQDIKACARFCNDYRFTKAGSNVLIVDEIIFEKMSLLKALGLNVKKMSETAFSQNGELQFYFPKTLPIPAGGSSIDYRTPEALDTTHELEFSSTYWENQDSAPDRAIEFVTDGEKRIVGLHHGFVPDMGNVATRKNYVINAWLLYHGTSYGYALDGATQQRPLLVEKGEHFSWATFRKYENVEDNPNGLICNSQFDLNGVHYIYLDFNASGDYSIPIPSKWVGKTISVIEKSNNVTLLNTFAQEEIMITVASSSPMYGYLVAKVSE